MNTHDNEELTQFLRSKLREANADFGFKGTAFLKMLNTEGGFKTILTLLAKKDPSDGFKELWIHRRLDLSVEAVVVETKWRKYFESQLIQNAESMLQKANYKFTRYEEKIAPLDSVNIQVYEVAINQDNLLPNDDGWKKEELDSAVRAYLEMLDFHWRGEKFSKSGYYENLSKKHNRTPKAFEFRMQNISYVLSKMGRDWLPGLKPAKNVGINIASQIEELIAAAENIENLGIAAFEIKVEEAFKNKALAAPVGNRQPTKLNATAHLFVRDPYVKAWVLRQSNGMCESCNERAPFLTEGGLPFLEVHHVKNLSNNGTDTISNTVAVCPNCHRELHFGQNKQSLAAALHSKIKRLIPE